MNSGLRPEQQLDRVIAWLDQFQHILANHPGGEERLVRLQQVAHELALIRVETWGTP